METRSLSVVVGVGDKQPTAIRFALREAHRKGIGLRVVHAAGVPAQAAAAYAANPQGLLDTAGLADVSPARLRQMVGEARARLDEFERLANEYEARDTLNAILAEHDLTLIEAPLDKLANINDDLADRLGCWVMEAPDGRGYVVAPSGQDPVERLEMVSAFVARRARKAVSA